MCVPRNQTSRIGGDQVYQMIDDILIIVGVAVGERERNNVYNLASEGISFTI